MSYDPTVEIPKEPVDRNIITAEEPRTHPLTYAAIIISILALLLSFVAIVDDPNPAQVQVGEKVCLVQNIEGEDLARLFCQS